MTSLAHILAETGDPTFLLPRGASNFSENVDWAFNLILYTCVFFFAIIVFAKIFFVIKYRRRSPDDQTPIITHNTPLEILWTGIPLVLVIAFFVVGFRGFLDYDTPPADAYRIEVEARKWGFTFYYPNGGVGSELFVPINKPVKLVLRSNDVLHAVFIPAFRIQRNAVPGRETQLWFIATKHSPAEGFPLFCTQYCGDGHSKMTSHVHVLDETGDNSFAKKLAELANPFKEKDAGGKEHWVPYVALGEKLAKSSGCAQCHSVDGKVSQGPTWKDLFKRDHRFSASDVPGFSLSAGDDDAKWEAYLRESVLHPDVKIVEGYPNIMPNFASTFEGKTGDFKDEKLRALVVYIKSLGSAYAGPMLDGKQYKPGAVPAELYDVKPGQDSHPESLKAQNPASASAASQPVN